MVWLLLPREGSHGAAHCHVLPKLSLMTNQQQEHLSSIQRQKPQEMEPQTAVTCLNFLFLKERHNRSKNGFENDDFQTHCFNAQTVLPAKIHS